MSEDEEGLETSPIDEIAVLTENIASPRHKVLYPLARWLSGDPHLQIFRTVVVLHTVLVVNIFMRQKRPPDDVRHHLPVLINVSIRNCVGVSRIVFDYVPEMTFVPLSAMCAVVKLATVHIAVFQHPLMMGDAKAFGF